MMMMTGKHLGSEAARAALKQYKADGWQFVLVELAVA